MNVKINLKKFRIMKTRIHILSLFVLSLALMSVAGCEKEDDFEARDPVKGRCLEAAVIELNVPDQVVAGQPARFKLVYRKPDPCHSLTGFGIHFNGNVADLSVCLLRGEDVCIQVIVFEEDIVEITFPHKGTFVLRYQGADEQESVVVTVK